MKRVVAFPSVKKNSPPLTQVEIITTKSPEELRSLALGQLLTLPSLDRQSVSELNCENLVDGLKETLNEFFCDSDIANLRVAISTFCENKKGAESILFSKEFSPSLREIRDSRDEHNNKVSEEEDDDSQDDDHDEDDELWVVMISDMVRYIVEMHNLRGDSRVKPASQPTRLEIRVISSNHRVPPPPRVAPLVSDETLALHIPNTIDTTSHQSSSTRNAITTVINEAPPSKKMKTAKTLFTIHLKFLTKTVFPPNQNHGQLAHATATGPSCWLEKKIDINSVNVGEGFSISCEDLINILEDMSKDGNKLSVSQFDKNKDRLYNADSKAGFIAMPPLKPPSSKAARSAKPVAKNTLRASSNKLVSNDNDFRLQISEPYDKESTAFVKISKWIDGERKDEEYKLADVAGEVFSTYFLVVFEDEVSEELLINNDVPNNVMYNAIKSSALTTLTNALFNQITIGNSNTAKLITNLTILRNMTAKKDNKEKKSVCASVADIVVKEYSTMMTNGSVNLITPPLNDENNDLPGQGQNNANHLYMRYVSVLKLLQKDKVDTLLGIFTGTEEVENERPSTNDTQPPIWNYPPQYYGGYPPHTFYHPTLPTPAHGGQPPSSYYGGYPTQATYHPPLSTPANGGQPPLPYYGSYPPQATYHPPVSYCSYPPQANYHPSVSTPANDGQPSPPYYHGYPPQANLHPSSPVVRQPLQPYNHLDNGQLINNFNAYGQPASNQNQIIPVESAAAVGQVVDVRIHQGAFLIVEDENGSI